MFFVRKPLSSDPSPAADRDMARLFATTILLICGQASSQRGRRGGVELREPKKELIPREDRHKFIHDGKEYDRPPNLFDVGGELKLLPEVFSDLNFEARNFVDDGTPEEQKELRDSRPWGRLYVDGWPAPIQYMRSHFGGPAVEGMRSMVVADPLDACESLRNEESAEAAVVIAARGNCTFTWKARNAQMISASALLIVNNEEGIIHPPGPDGKDLDIFSAMIPQAEGNVLIETMKHEATKGLLIPMNCQEGSGLGDKNQLCHPAIPSDRLLVKNLALGGFVILPNGEKFEYLLADFGTKVPSRALMLTSAQPPDACAAADVPGKAEGKAVLVKRGNCGFIDKADAILRDNGDAAALIVVNNETSLFHMGASPRWRGTNISFPTLLISDMAGRALFALPSDSVIHLTPAKDANVHAWDRIEQLREACVGPAGASECRSMLETLVSTNAGFVDRLSALRDAFQAATISAMGEQADEVGSTTTKLNL